MMPESTKDTKTHENDMKTGLTGFYRMNRIMHQSIQRHPGLSEQSWRSFECLRVLRGFLIFSLFVVATGTWAEGPKPEVKSVSVMGLRAGRTTSVVIYGENLAPKEVTVKPPLTVKLGDVKATDEKTKSKGSKQVTVEVTVPANCPRESFDLTLVQPDGVKAIAQIAVVDDAAQEVQIKTPASTFAQAMLIHGPSVAISGQLDGDTADVIRLDAKAGETWDISLLSGRGGSLLDPVLRIRDKRHFSLMLSAGDKKKDRHLVFKPTTDGPYYIEITEGEARGGTGYTYRLTVNRK